jgi:hypothetical protein
VRVYYAGEGAAKGAAVAALRASARAREPWRSRGGARPPSARRCLSKLGFPPGPPGVPKDFARDLMG